MLKDPLSVRVTSLTVTVTLDIGVFQTTMSVMEQTTVRMEEMKTPVYAQRGLLIALLLNSTVLQARLVYITGSDVTK